MEAQSKSPAETFPAGATPNGGAVQTDNTGVASRKSDKRKRRWGRRLLLLLVLAASLYAFRAPLLRSVACYLVVDEPIVAANRDDEPPEILILPGVDKRYDCAAGLYRSGSATAILLVERRPNRLERMGFLPTFERESQRELSARGVPADSIRVIRGKVRTDWECARCLRDWLQQQPTVRVLVLCDRFGGRKLRYILDQVLGTEYAGRVRLKSLPERSYDENNWWQHREALVQLFDAYLNLAYARLCGEESEAWQEWDPEEFKKTLR